MEINIRKETLADYRIVEELTQEAFWGSMEHPTWYILQLAEMGVVLNISRQASMDTQNQHENQKLKKGDYAFLHRLLI